ncbi:MAG: hypothetical protein P8182_18275 [Deltaproteobacteria bacterium]
MSKALRLVVVVVALVAFGMATVSVAAEFYVVKGKDGKQAVVDKKPADAKAIVKGPFKTKAEAMKAAAAKAPKAGAAAKKPLKLPDAGC